MKARDVAVNTQVIWGGINALCLGTMKAGGNVLLGWKLNDPKGDRHGWSKDDDSQEVKRYMERYACQWGLWISPSDELVIAKVTVNGVDGLFCKLCHDFASFAEPNRPDGKFICFSCRQGWIPAGM